jgi:hypothetical protein
MPRLAVWGALSLLVAVLLAGGGSPVELVTLAAVAVLVLTVVRLAEPSAPSVRARARVLRECARRSAFLRSRDPDADGRVRPRAPGRCAVSA